METRFDLTCEIYMATRFSSGINRIQGMLATVWFNSCIFTSPL